MWRSACDHRPAPAVTLGARRARLMRESVTWARVTPVVVGAVAGVGEERFQGGAPVVAEPVRVPPWRRYVPDVASGRTRVLEVAAEKLSLGDRDENDVEPGQRSSRPGAPVPVGAWVRWWSRPA